MDAKTTALLGGRKVRVALLDGATEEIMIRQVAIRNFPKLLEALADEPGLIKLYTGKDDAWVDSLQPEAFELIIQEGEKLNADFFQRWFNRAKHRLDLVAPGGFERLFGMALTLPTGSPK